MSEKTLEDIYRDMIIGQLRHDGFKLMTTEEKSIAGKERLITHWQKTFDDIECTIVVSNYSLQVLKDYAFVSGNVLKNLARDMLTLHMDPPGNFSDAAKYQQLNFNQELAVALQPWLSIH